jgi:hypothetical protein
VSRCVVPGERWVLEESLRHIPWSASITYLRREHPQWEERICAENVEHDYSFNYFSDNRNVAVMLWLNGRSEHAVAILKPMPKDPDRSHRLSLVYASAGRYSEAADALLEAPPGSYPQAELDEAARLLRGAPSPATLPQEVNDLGELDFVYAYVGAPERALDFEERNVNAGRVSALGSAVFFHPSFAEVRKSPKFKSYLVKTGLVEYWRAKGWPDQCRPTTGDDFECS